MTLARTVPAGRAVLAVFLLALTSASAHADRTKDPRDVPRPAAALMPVPESVDGLRVLEKQVKAVLAKVVPCTVAVVVGGASGSGVIVKDGYVLTAGHVSGEPGKNATVILPDGKRLRGKTLGRNSAMDSGMIKITDKNKLPSAEMGDADKVQPGQWCISVGHPGGFKKGRTPVVRLGRVVSASGRLIRTDCTLVGGDSGGPLFDLDGKVIGIHSRIGYRIQDNVHVPIDTYRSTWDRLVKGESWGSWRDMFVARTTAPYMGVLPDPDGPGCAIKEVNPGTPAEKAGFKAGDVITQFGGEKVENVEDLRKLLDRKKPGDEVYVQVRREKEVVKLKIVLGKQPRRAD